MGKAHALGSPSSVSHPSRCHTPARRGHPASSSDDGVMRGCLGKSLGRGGGRIEWTPWRLQRDFCHVGHVEGSGGLRPSRLLLFQNLPRLGENLSMAQRTAQKGSQWFGGTRQSPLIQGLRDGMQEPRLPTATWRGWLFSLLCTGKRPMGRVPGKGRNATR